MTKHQQQKRYITAFGSSRIAQDDIRFQDVQVLSAKIAALGWSGFTGGHQGMMAAFSQGMHQGDAWVTGVTLEVFPTPPENTFSQEQRASTFFERMQLMIEQAEAYLVLDGGLGTLAELAMTWDLMAIQVIEPRPIILYGDCWAAVLDVLKAQLVMSVDHGFDCIHLCQSHEEVLKILQQGR